MHSTSERQTKIPNMPIYPRKVLALFSTCPRTYKAKSLSIPSHDHGSIHTLPLLHLPYPPQFPHFPLPPSPFSPILFKGTLQNKKENKKNSFYKRGISSYTLPLSSKKTPHTRNKNKLPNMLH